MINIYLNDKEYFTHEGRSILEACNEASINIPTFCYDERLKAEGSCRICIVEVEGSARLVPACSTTVLSGMKVKTHSPKVVSMRKNLLETMLSNHDVTCLQ